jgi:hypothetical protein
MTAAQSADGRVTVARDRRNDSRSESECRGRGSNPHDRFRSQDFKSCASASFATPALRLLRVYAVSCGIRLRTAPPRGNGGRR